MNKDAVVLEIKEKSLSFVSFSCYCEAWKSLKLLSSEMLVDFELMKFFSWCLAHNGCWVYGNTCGCRVSHNSIDVELIVV